MTDEKSESDEFFFEKPCNLCIGKALPKKTPFILSMAKNGGEGGGAAQIVSDTFLTVIFPKKIIVY